MRTARNVGIVMALAAVIAFVPSGGNLAEAVLTAITLGFLVAITWALYVFSRQNQLTLAALSDGRRAFLYGGLGLIALLVAGSDEMFSSGFGTLLWLLGIGVAVATIWRVWTEANTY